MNEGAEIDRWVLERPLGAGGMASVWLARHRTLGSHHAVKVLQINHPSLAQRLLREGRIQATLVHPNIVAVTDVVETQWGLMLVMPYVDGPTLSQWLERSPRDAVLAMALFRAVLDGIEFAHDHDVAHRDLKPSNVLLKPQRGTFIAQVADFGVARALTGEGGLTRSGAVMGTLGYMPPEQATGRDGVDHRADVFALGVILHQMVTGELPFPSEDIFEYVASTQMRAWHERSALRTRLDPRVDAAIAGALQPDPATRWPSVAALRDALGALDRLEPIQWAEAETPRLTSGWGEGTEQLVAEVRQPERRLRAGVAAGVAVGLLGALALGAWVAWPVAAPPSVVPATPADVSPPAPAPPAEPALPPAPVVADPVGKAPPAPVATPQPAPAAVPVVAVAPEPAPSTGHIEVRGAADVRLVSAHGTWPPGDVPPGTWEVFATLGGRPGKAGVATVGVGERVVMTCDDAFRMCTQVR